MTRKVLDLNPGEMLKATAYAALIEALRSEGKFREGNRIGERLLDEGTSNFAKTIAYYEMAYNLAEMEEDLDEALDYARRSLELAPDELKQFPLAALGWVHYKRKEFEQAVDFLAALERARAARRPRSPTSAWRCSPRARRTGRAPCCADARSLGERGGALAGEDDGVHDATRRACSSARRSRVRPRRQ